MTLAPISLGMRLGTLPLREPFHISGVTFREFPVITVSLTSAGLTGRGEAAGVYYIGDTPARMPGILERVRAAIESGLTRQDLRQLLPPGGARNAVDCALWELEALRVGRAVWQLAGVQRPVPRVCTMTVGAGDPAEMAAGARSFASATALKLKLTGDTDLDIDRVKAVRSSRPDTWLSVDANQGYTPASIERLIPVLVACQVGLLEQPFARGREQDMTLIDFPMDTGADESCQDLSELEQVHELFDVINIKLDKCGGLTEGLMLAERCRQLGRKVMVGNMGGTGLAMAPAFVLGQCCDLVDLDGPVHITNDCDPSVRYVDGEVFSPQDVWGGAACA